MLLSATILTQLFLTEFSLKFTAVYVINKLIKINVKLRNMMCFICTVTGGSNSVPLVIIEGFKAEHANNSAQ